MLDAMLDAFLLTDFNFARLTWPKNFGNGFWRTSFAICVTMYVSEPSHCEASACTFCVFVHGTSGAQMLHLVHSWWLCQSCILAFHWLIDPLMWQILVLREAAQSSAFNFEFKGSAMTKSCAKRLAWVTVFCLVADRSNFLQNQLFSSITLEITWNATCSMSLCLKNVIQSKRSEKSGNAFLEGLLLILLLFPSFLPEWHELQKRHLSTEPSKMACNCSCLGIWHQASLCSRPCDLKRKSSLQLAPRKFSSKAGGDELVHVYMFRMQSWPRCHQCRSFHLHSIFQVLQVQSTQKDLSSPSALQALSYSHSTTSQTLLRETMASSGCGR